MLNVGLWRDLAKKELQVPARWHAGTRKVGGVDSCETTIFRCHIRISGGRFKMVQWGMVRKVLVPKFDHHKTLLECSHFVHENIAAGVVQI